MKNDLFRFWAGGWKAYAEEEEKNRQVVIPATWIARLLKIGKSIFSNVDKSIDKRLF